MLRSIYFASFESNLNYYSLVWDQNYNAINRLVILHKKAFRVMNFEPRNSHPSPLFRKMSVLKLKDKISLEYILFFSKYVNNHLPCLFNNWFAFPSDTYGLLMINSKNIHIELTRMVKLNTVSPVGSSNSSQNYLKGYLTKTSDTQQIQLPLSNEYLKIY